MFNLLYKEVEMADKQSFPKGNDIIVDLSKSDESAKKGVEQDTTGKMIHICGIHNNQPCPCRKCREGCATCTAVTTF